MLKLSDVSVFHGELQALHQVSMEVKQGELVALIGANGAGKTTMVNTICGLHRPRTGEIIFEGHRIDQVPAHQIVGLGIAQVAEGRQLLEGGLALAGRALAVDDLRAAAPHLHHLGDELRGVLQVRVDDDDRVAPGLLQDGRHQNRCQPQ